MWVWNNFRCVEGGFFVCQCYGTLDIIERTLLKEEEFTLKQAVDVAVSMELVETEVSKRKGP